MIWKDVQTHLINKQNVIKEITTKLLFLPIRLSKVKQCEIMGKWEFSTLLWLYIGTIFLEGNIAICFKMLRIHLLWSNNIIFENLSQENIWTNEQRYKYEAVQCHSVDIKK